MNGGGASACFTRAYETVSLGCQEKDLGVAVGTHSHLIADGSWDAASVSYLHKVSYEHVIMTSCWIMREATLRSFRSVAAAVHLPPHELHEELQLQPAGG